MRGILLFVMLLLCVSPLRGLFGNIIGTATSLVANMINIGISVTEFSTKYQRRYSSANEMAYRGLVLKKNLNKIYDNNRNLTSGFRMGVTRFADMEAKEFEQQVLMQRLNLTDVTPNANLASRTTLESLNTWPLNSFSPTKITRPPLYPTAINSLASSLLLTSPFSMPNEGIDWRKKNMAGVVRDQGVCGSCYAFSALSAIEGMYLANNMTQLGNVGKFIGSNVNASLSAQHIVDCCDVQGKCDLGCGGGFPWDVFDFIVRHGVNLEATYPYKEMEIDYVRKCQGISGQYKNLLNPTQPYTNVTRKDVDSLAKDLAKGPVSVLINADNLAFFVPDPSSSKPVPFKNCSSSNVNHAMLLVGVDNSGNWLVKNSWGVEWGDKGYITLAPGNTCGIANYALYPNPNLSK